MFLNYLCSLNVNRHACFHSVMSVVIYSYKVCVFFPSIFKNKPLEPGNESNVSVLSKSDSL